MKDLPPLPLLILLATTALDAVSATWSIVAIDKTTNQIGSAMATCLDNHEFPDNARDFLGYGFSAVPCQGAIVAQAKIQDDSGPAATVGVPLLETGTVEAQDIINAITKPEADPQIGIYPSSNGDPLYLQDYDIRQYGIATYSAVNPVASYTGPQLTTLYRAFGFDNTEETSESVVTENYTASVQGNIVFPGTVAATATAFRESMACDFVERLFGALKQGYLATGGDVRCAANPATKGAVLAYLKVMDADGTYSIDLEARLGLPENASALDAIEDGLLAWRQENPCGAAPNSTAAFACIASDDSELPDTNTTSDDSKPPDTSNSWTVTAFPMGSSGLLLLVSYLLAIL